MFASKIVFVLGAGAGQDINMPVGRQLANAIAKKMHVEMDSVGRMTSTGGDLRLFTEVSGPNDFESWLPAAAKLRNGLPLSRSIDDFLNFHQKDSHTVKLGKAAIVRSVLEAERSSRIFFERRNINDSIDFEGIAATWYVKFMHMLEQENYNTVFDNVAFIDFNYDRCLEHFLIHAVHAIYGLGEADAVALVTKAKIIHPYGYIGRLPEMGGSIPYGHTTGQVVPITDHILTYSEQMRDERIGKEIAAVLTDAIAIVFLGFAYHAQNMNLLRPNPALRPKRVFGTALGISQSDLTLITRRVVSIFDPDSQSEARGLLTLYNNLDCSGLLDQHMLSLPEFRG